MMRRLSDVIWLASLFILLYVSHVVDAQPQSFTTEPRNVTVIQGQRAVINCVVANRKGEVQWIKNGLALGYERKNIPGFPTYEVQGVENIEYNLFIYPTTLDDDAEFQCQVGPFGDIKALRGIGHLIVQVPPFMPEIEGYTNGSIVKIPSGLTSHSLVCRANGGKPAATITWFRNGVEVTEGIQYSTEEVGNKTQNAISVLTLKPTKDENEAIFTCQAINPALVKPLQTTVQLSVMYPPGLPRIEGYETGRILKAGDTLKMTCISQGGNPLAEVYWYRNDKEVDFQFVTTPNRAENEILFTVMPTDNGAVYRCDVSNLVLVNSNTPPYKAEVKLNVYFPPNKVTISGTENNKANTLVKLKCVTGISNPAAKITWTAKNVPVAEKLGSVVASPQGGFVTTSEIEVMLGTEEMVVYECTAANDALGNIVRDSLTLRVLYPPTSLSITGYQPGKEIKEGDAISLGCESNGGNPLPELMWTRISSAGRKVLSGLPRITLGIKTFQTSFILSYEDNGVQLECSAMSEAMDKPMTQTITLNVHFPPKTINVTSTPARPKVGQDTTLACRSGSSNPPSKMTWKRNGDDIIGVDGGQEPGSWGGVISKTSLQIIPTSRDNGAIYACTASNNLLDRTISDAITLNVAFKPEFPDSIPPKLTLREFSSTTVNFTALANPADVTYTWTKDGVAVAVTRKNKRDVSPPHSIPHFIQQKGVLMITNVTRRDAGNYNLQAANAEGRTDLKFALDVQYPAGIPRTSGSLTVDSGQNAVLECEVDANPIDENTVKWSRANFDMSRTTTTLDQTVTARNRAVSKLTVNGVTKTDAGQFYCEASNGLGSAITSVVELLIKFAPEIIKTADADRAATDVGKNATLKCTASGVPDVTFAWFKNDEPLESQPRFSMVTYKIIGSSIPRSASELTILSTVKEDFVAYKCVAKNDLGEDRFEVRLTLTSQPSAPIDLRFINATHNSIAIDWLPGFDGGYPQVFEVRYSEVGQPGYTIVDAPNNPNIDTKYVAYVIKGLKLGANYEITVRGRNSLGAGPFFSNYIHEKTSSVLPVTEDKPYFNVPFIIILIITVSGLALLLCNILLILFLFRRRMKKGKSLPSDTVSQANTLELYRPPVYTDDSKSYSTYERRSLPDDDYRAYDPAIVQDDSEKKFLPTPYVRPENYYANARVPSTQNVGQPYPEYPNHHGSNLDIPYVKGPRSATSREKLYDDRSGYPRNNMERYPSGSLGHRPAPNDLREGDEDEYTEQLRQIQRAISPEADMPLYPYRAAIPAPVRASNQNVSDGYPRASRHYEPEDVPRYYPSTNYGSSGNVYRGDSLPQGQLV